MYLTHLKIPTYGNLSYASFTPLQAMVYLSKDDLNILEKEMEFVVLFDDHTMLSPLQCISSINIIYSTIVYGNFIPGYALSSVMSSSVA